MALPFSTASSSSSRSVASSLGAGEQPSPPPPAARKRWGPLKFGTLAAIAGALGGAGYVNYTYTLDEVDQKMWEFRKNPTPPVPEDASGSEDLSKLNRNPAQVLYISWHALESCLQPENCVTIKPWKLETDDTRLLDLIPFLEYLAMARPSDIRTVLASYQGRDVATDFIERSKEHQRRMQEQNMDAYGDDDR